MQFNMLIFKGSQGFTTKQSNDNNNYNNNINNNNFLIE